MASLQTRAKASLPVQTICTGLISGFCVFLGKAVMAKATRSGAIANIIHITMPRVYCNYQADVRFGSEADVGAAKRDVRFAPNSNRKSRHAPRKRSCPLYPPEAAINVSGLWAKSKAAEPSGVMRLQLLSVGLP
jgi:hypothetical protein